MVSSRTGPESDGPLPDHDKHRFHNIWHRGVSRGTDGDQHEGRRTGEGQIWLVFVMVAMSVMALMTSYRYFSSFSFVSFLTRASEINRRCRGDSSTLTEKVEDEVTGTQEAKREEETADIEAGCRVRFAATPPSG